VEIDLSEPVALSFSLKYLVNFTKATGLSSQVRICLSNEVPLLVEYSLSNNSYLRFYLAPKVSENPLKPVLQPLTLSRSETMSKDTDDPPRYRSSDIGAITFDTV
jgi:DNA polymerase III sliding clamp (beta) subunit (PCNA family)